MARASSSERAARLESRAYEHYAAGRTEPAIKLWEKHLTFSLTPEEDLETRRWLSSALHNRGELERAAELLEAICFDPGAARIDPGKVYRIAARAGCVAVDRALPLARIEALMRRIAELAEGANDCAPCHQLLAQGKLEIARGRRAAGLRLVERGFAARKAKGATLSDSPYLRVLIPGALERGQSSRARELLDLWDQCGDPEAFKSPHLEAFNALWHLRCGELGAALRWALLARERCGKCEDISGRFDAAHALCRASLQTGFIAVCRGELRKLLALRRIARPDVRFAIELIAIDTHAGLARFCAGLPLADLETGAEQPSRGAVDTLSAVAAKIGLRRAERACRRGEVLAKALDANLGSRHRRRAVARRRRGLRELRRLLAFATAARVAPARASLTGAFATKPPAVRRVSPASPVVLESKPTGSRLLLPAVRMRSIASALKASAELRLVLRPAKGETPLRVDVWSGRKWQSRVEVEFASGRGGPWCAIRVDASAPPPWLEQFAAAARLHHAKRLLSSGELALARGAHERAVRDFDAARALAADRWQHWEAGARGRVALRRADEAFDLCLRALELDSTEHHVWSCLADILELQNRLPEARHALQQALTRAPIEGSTAEQLKARMAKLELRLAEMGPRLYLRQLRLPLS